MSTKPDQVQRFGGEREDIALSGDRPTVVYVFTPSCLWCARNMANVQVLVEAVETSHRVIALSLAPDVGDYVRQHGLTVPVYIEPDLEAMEGLGLGPTPHTIVLSADGKVERTWLGAYSGKIAEEVQSYFGVTLPGLLERQVLGR